MTPQRWTRVQALFEEALAQPAAERAEWVEARADDPDMAALAYPPECPGAPTVAAASLHMQWRCEDRRWAPAAGRATQCPPLSTSVRTGRISA